MSGGDQFYHPNIRMDGSYKQYGQCRQDRYYPPLLAMKPRFLGCPFFWQVPVTSVIIYSGSENVSTVR